jgi:chemotaxis protein MotB
MTRSRRGRGGHGGGGGGGGGHGGGDARWLVTYADLLTLLMVLFRVLWVISTIDAKKFEKFKEGLGDFGNPAAVAAAQGNTKVVNKSPNTDGEYNASTTTTIATADTSAGSDGATVGSVLDATKLGGLVAGLQQAIDGAGLGGVVNVNMYQRGLVISVSTDDVLFEPGSAVLGPEAALIISTVAPELANIGNDVIVEGYTDKRPLHRQGYDNWDLSVDRAVSVLKLLRDSPGIAPERLAATGYGDQHPIDDGDTEAAYAKNRRVEIVVVAGPVDGGAAPVTGTTVATI